MTEAANTPQGSGVPDQFGKYFKLQIRGWTDFDPMDKTLAEIAEAIQRGGGFLTAVEVLEVKDDPAAISDNQVREGFQNILAVRRVLRSIEALPQDLLRDLRTALNSRDEAGKKPAVSDISEAVPAKRAS